MTTRLDEISTEWSILVDPARFVARYEDAIRRYLSALIKNPHDAEEVVQDFFLKITRLHGFFRVRAERGRFRDYLKSAIRNAALNFLRDKQPASPIDSALWLRLTADRSQPEAEQAWLDECRRCLLERAWQALERRQKASRGSLAHTVLRLIVEDPDQDSSQLAARTSLLAGRRIRADAFRKQVSRARLLFARALVDEVAETLDQPTPTLVQEELMDLSLWEYVRNYLPPGWGAQWSTPRRQLRLGGQSS
jgi:RNA polymerase sigma factor (sigma-70 family)